MIVARSREASSGVRFFQKYCRALSPAVGMPFAASTLEISLSMKAQPPSPETKTTSVSEVPCVAGTSTSGNEGVAAEATPAKRRMRIAYFIRTDTLNSGTRTSYSSTSSVQQLDSARRGLRRGRGRCAGVDDVGEEEVGVGLLVGGEADDEVALWLREI